MIDAQLLHIPVVKRAMIFKLQRTDGMRDAFHGIRLAVGEIVHRIDTPLIAGTMMLGVQDAIHDGIAQVQVRRPHVDLGAQRSCSIRKLTRLHASEQIQILFHGSVAIRALLPRLGQRAALLANLIWRQIVYVRFSSLDQLNCPFIKLSEIIGCIEQPVAPIAAQPACVFDNGIDVLGLFFGWVRVVEPQVALAAELLRQPEIQSDRFGMPDVQIAVRLGRKARMNAALVFIGF